MNRMLERFKDRRPYQGYEWTTAPSRTYGGHGFYVWCMSSGTAWPYWKCRAHHSTFFDGPNSIDIRVKDPEEERARRGWRSNRPHDEYKKHDFTCGHISMQIMKDAVSSGAIQEIVKKNQELLLALIEYVKVPRQDGSGCPQGSSVADPFKTLNCCKQGRHRAGLFSYSQASWINQLGFGVRLEHKSLFLDIRGPCDCGRPDGWCNQLKGWHGETPARNKAWIAEHRPLFFEAVREYSEVMMIGCADEIAELEAIFENNFSACAGSAAAGSARACSADASSAGASSASAGSAGAGSVIQIMIIFLLKTNETLNFILIPPI